ncbi:hypothetical protein [Halalkalicoccus subterraneus]|uniref:hypothetical protein n=1 Tax=Halalkalicoccus subterraneus TaxID=2675002 RepID=UPI000EFB656B|nr:hypothetical protein [Halalkalicoccus subterraneus]
MAALWTYPWTMVQEGLDEACESIVERGLDAITVSSHYHSVRSLQPQHPTALFRQFPGGCHFSPDADRFDECPIIPPTVTIDGFEDPLAEITAVAHDHGLTVNAWMVCLHNTRLGAMNPEYRIESAFGDSHDHSLCPSHPAVREYFATVVEALVDRSVDGIHLESIGFPSAFHGHGREFGHDKRQVLTDPAETVLLSQCFCTGCQHAAESRPVDLARAKARVRDLLGRALADPTTETPSLESLIRDEPILDALFEFRAMVVEALVGRLADAAGTVPLNYYVAESPGGADPEAVWPAGVRPDRLDASLDHMTAMCYVTDPTLARERVRTLKGMVDSPVDAGLTLDPGVVGTPSELHALVDILEDDLDGQLSFYHHGLLSETQLDWIGSAIGGS